MKPASLNWPPKPINANYWDPVLLLNCRRATLGKDLGESSNFSPKQRSLSSHNCGWTVKQNEDKIISCQDMTKPSTFTQLLFSRLKHIMYNDDNKRAAAACERSKLVFKTLSLSSPCWGWGVAAQEGFMIQGYPPQMGWATPCTVLGQVALWTGPNTTHCTAMTDKVHCIAAPLLCQGATESCPLPLLLQCDVSRVYSSIRRTGTQQQCTELQCTEKALISTALHWAGHHCTE